MLASTQREKVVGLCEAFAAALIWGFAFITLRWAVGAFGPIWSRALSFAAVAFVALPIGIAVRPWRKHLNRSQISLAFLPGMALGAGLCFQSLGIRHTSVANSGFITVLYIVLIPIGERTFFSQKLHPIHWTAVALALIGSTFLCGGLPTNWNVGDLLTLGCAALGAGHFLALQRVAPRVSHSFFFNILQVAWATVFTLPFAMAFEDFPQNLPDFRAVASLIFLAYGSIMVGFMFQVRAQRVLSSTVAGLVCLLEGPFAAIFAFYLLGEGMSSAQTAGAAIVLAAAAMAGFAPAPVSRVKSAATLA